jgi:hypothetical protein
MFARIIKFVRQEKFILLVMAATIVTFLVVSLFSYRVTHWFELRFFDTKTGQVQQGIVADSRYVFQSMERIAASSGIANLIETKNIPQLASALRNAQTTYGLDAMNATDGKGVVLTRTQVTSRSGDYIFQTTPYGQKVAEGTPVVSIERGSALPLLMIAGYPVTDHRQTVGAVFGGYSIDDAYAHGFRSKYLTDSENLIFYSNQDGVVGTTFEASGTRPLLVAYFNTGSDWIQKGQSDREVIIEGRVYFVKNIVFPGLDGSPGGMLVLYPTGYTEEATLFSLIIALIFAIIVFYLHTRGATKRRQAAEVIILIVCSLIVFSVVFFTDRALLYNHSISVQKPPYTIYNSTLTLNPSSAIWSKSSEQQVAVNVLTGGEAINAAQIDLTYDPTKIQVADIITADSFCAPAMFLEKSIDNRSGEVRVACALPSPGFSGQSGNVVTLAVQPIRMGSVVLHFATDTQILANDGLGTDVLRLATDGSYRTINESALGNSTSSVLVFSPTYPNRARWYNKPKGIFTWIDHAGYSYRYSLDNSPAVATLMGASTTSADSVSLSGLTDGIHYFHIQPTGDGGAGVVSDYKVMIDATPPSIPTIKASATTTTEGQILRLEFESQDNESGLESNYYIRFDDGVFLPAASPLFISLPAGTHIITVRAFDRAGNFANGNTTITVTQNQ